MIDLSRTEKRKVAELAVGTIVALATLVVSLHWWDAWVVFSWATVLAGIAFAIYLIGQYIE